MSDDARQEPHARPHSAPVAEPFVELDLNTEVHRLHAETTWSNGQNAKTLSKYNSLRVVLMTLQAGRHVPEHKTEGRVSIHVLSGHIEVRAAGRTFNLRPGALLALDRNISHDVRALDESAMLLSVAWPGGGAGAAIMD